MFDYLITSLLPPPSKVPKNGGDPKNKNTIISQQCREVKVVFELIIFTFPRVVVAPSAKAELLCSVIGAHDA